MKPSDDPKADELRNKNLSKAKEENVDPPGVMTEEKIEAVIKK